MGKIAAWLSGWATTLHIMVFERDTYRQLREPFNPDDYADAPRPESRGTEFSEWAEEQKANETPAQAELCRRFAEIFRDQGYRP